MKIIRLRALIFCALLVTAACGQSFGTYFAPTAAVVNGAKIPEEAISAELRRALESPEFAQVFGGPQGDQSRRDAQKEILTRLIREEVIKTEAQRIGIRVGDAEAGDRFDQVRAGFGSEEAFEAERRRQGFTIEEVMEFFRRQILVEKVQAHVAKDINVTEEDLRSAYEQRAAQYQSQARAAHILVCANFDAETRTCSITPEDEALAGSLTARARAGEDFGALAREHSRDAGSAMRDGDLGWLASETLVQSFADAVAAMNPGDISDPVQSQFGYHVIKLIAKGRPFEDARSEIEEQVITPRQQQAFGEWLQGAMERADIRVNPLFGRFDPSTQTVVAGGTAENGQGERQIIEP